MSVFHHLMQDMIGYNNIQQDIHIHIACFIDFQQSLGGSQSSAEDWDAPVQESCAKLNATCPCGANAKPCKWTDEWGLEEDGGVRDGSSRFFDRLQISFSGQVPEFRENDM